MTMFPNMVALSSLKILILDQNEQRCMDTFFLGFMDMHMHNELTSNFLAHRHKTVIGKEKCQMLNLD